MLKVIFYLILTAVIAYALFFIWKLKLQADSIQVTPPPTPTPSISSAPDDLTYWKTFETSVDGLKLKYPPDWSIGDNTIYELALPKDPNPNGIYNFISMEKQPSILYGYYVTDLFEKIDSLKVDQTFKLENFDSENTIFIKKASGRISSGHRYVIFQYTSIKVNWIEYKAYILKNNQLIILSLHYSDEPGLAIFKDIIKSSSFPVNN